MVELTLLQRLEASGDETEVRALIARGHYNATELLAVNEWLRNIEASNLSASAARKEAREEENLSISRRALDISERASRRALIAIALSTTMAIYEIIKWYSTK